MRALRSGDSDPTCAVIGCGWRCASDSGPSSRSHVGRPGSGPFIVGFLDQGARRCTHLVSLVAPSGRRETGRLVDVVGKVARPDRSDAVLALIVGGLGRAWRKQTQASTELRNRSVLQPTSHDQRVQPHGSTSSRSRAWPAWSKDYRVVRGRARDTSCARPTGRIVRIQHNSRTTAATIVARRTLTAVTHQRLTN